MIERLLLALAVVFAFAALIWGWTEFNHLTPPTGGPFTLILIATGCLGLWFIASPKEKSIPNS